MKKKPVISSYTVLELWIRSYRRRLGDENALLPLSFLGIFVGLLTGIIIQLFRFSIEWPGDYFYGFHEAFENLSPTMRFAIPIYGALSLGLFLQFIIKQAPNMGLTHVVLRINQHHGRLPLRAAILQFFLGVWCILTGQSSGREGAAIHLGAAASSLTAQMWQLPSNSIRVLTGCGSAAAIAASFNTPIAGVIFAMEVVMMEYSITGFIPVILAASAGTVISHLIYGSAPAFIVPELAAHSVFELPAFIILGIGTGIAAALFCFIHKKTSNLDKIPLWLRLTLAGIVTGSLAFFFPEIMGIGYDTLDKAMEAKIGLYLLLAITIAKILATATSSGLGMPVGVIGPTLVAGGCLGGAIGIGINFLAPNSIANDSYYVLLGMGAMMGAVLNAPLAALIALLELTNTIDIILPAMISIVTATLINGQVFKQQAPHTLTLQSKGKHQNLSMFQVALQRVGVSSLMNSNVVLCAKNIEKSELFRILSKKPRWLIIEDSNQQLLLNATNIEQTIDENEELINLKDEQEIKLLSLPGEQIKLATGHFQDSAFEIWQIMEKEGVEAVYISGAFDSYAPEISGIITRRDLEDFYHKPRIF